MNKIQFSRISPQSQSPISVKNLVAKLVAGGFERCAACFDWISWKKLAAVASYESHAGSEPIPYCVCKKCMAKAMQSPEAWLETHKRIAQFLTP